MTFADRSLTCRDCGTPFNFSAREQEFYSTKGFENEPARCPDCRAARKQDYNLDHVRAWLLTLFEGRVILVTNDNDLAKACANVGVLIDTATGNARRRDFRVLQEFFMNEALFSLPHLFPLRD